MDVKPVSKPGLWQENEEEFILYWKSSEFSSEYGEILYGSSLEHALAAQKIWGMYLKQEKSY